MNDHHLDDLIISEPEPGGGKSKSLLTLVALLLIIVIVGILLAKMIFGGPETLEEPAPTEITGVVAPKNGGATAPKKAHPVESIPDDLKPISDETLPESADLKPIAPTRPKPAAPKPQAAEKKPMKIETKPARQSAVPQAKPKPKPKPTQLFEKKPRSKPKPQRTTASSGKRSYYIQVGSFKRMPNQKFLDKIKAAGYEPIIVRSGSMIKVRIGTYGSYGEAKAKLPEIKQKIGIDGFVVRKK
jgi:DedD protein